MSLKAAPTRMSRTKIAPEGPKPQEYERNACRCKQPSPYIPEKDVIQEVVDSSANMLKLTLPHKLELHVPVWSRGTHEQFLIHVQQAVDTIRQKCLLTTYKKAVKGKEVCITKLTKATEALRKSIREKM